MFKKITKTSLKETLTERTGTPMELLVILMILLYNCKW